MEGKQLMFHLNNPNHIHFHFRFPGYTATCVFAFSRLHYLQANLCNSIINEDKNLLRNINSAARTIYEGEFRAFITIIKGNNLAPLNKTCRCYKRNGRVMKYTKDDRKRIYMQISADEENAKWKCLQRPPVPRKKNRPIGSENLRMRIVKRKRNW